MSGLYVFLSCRKLENEDKTDPIAIKTEMDYLGFFNVTERINMFSNQRLWARTRDELVREIENLGFPAELGEAIARHLGSPKAMERMIAYLRYVRPQSEELIVDEMLAIRSEVDAWREKKASEEANAKYNEMLYYGLED